MATTLRGEGRPGQGRIRSSGGIPIVEETFHYLVESDADPTTETRLNVLATSGLPIVNLSIGSSGLSVCRSKDAVRRENQVHLWDVVATFTSEVQENGADLSTDPNTWIPVYETKFERLQEVVTKDLDGTSVANSAGQPFENGLTIGRFIPYWEIFQFESAGVSDETIIDRNEIINSNVFKGRPAKSLLLTVTSSVVGFYYGYPRRLTQYQIRYNSRLWTHKRLDVGTVYIGGGGTHSPYLDEDGNVMLGGLDGNGAKVAVGDPPETLEFEIYEKKSFNFLRG